VNKQEIVTAIDYLTGYTKECCHTELSKKYHEIAISALEHQLTNGWIPVDNLPKEKGWYLVYAEGQRPFVAYFKGKTFPLNNHYHNIIAWQPLPEPYTEQ
jgi:hypothetical protein